MPKSKLTKRLVDAAELPQAGENDLFLWDNELRGFGVRIKPSGIKSYLIQYRGVQGERRITIGRHGVLTLDEARKIARQELANVAKGDDPAKTRKDRREAPTMRELADDFMEHHAIPNKRPASVRDDRSMLERIVLPKFGSRKLAEIERKDVEALMRGLAATPYQANRVRALLSKMFAKAIEWGLRADNPVQGVEKFPEEPRDRWLRDDELQRLFHALDRYPGNPAADVVRLLLLTGARRSEVLRLSWDQLDFERGVWRKPAHTTKQKRTQHLPLSGEAINLLRRLQQEANSGQGFVFPGKVNGRPLTDIKKFWQRVLVEAEIRQARLHDLRHTHASHLVSSGLSLPVVGRMLGHTQAQTTQRYAHLADDPMRSAADSIASKFTQLGIASTDKPTKFRRLPRPKSTKAQVT